MQSPLIMPALIMQSALIMHFPVIMQSPLPICFTGHALPAPRSGRDGVSKGA